MAENPAAAAWATLSAGCYLPAEYCPAELAEELISAVATALELEPGVPLSRAHSLRMRFAWQAAADSATGAGKHSLRDTMARIEIAAGPNFKDVLRARVLSLEAVAPDLRSSASCTVEVSGRPATAAAVLAGARLDLDDGRLDRAPDP
jgi:hypothetical protein